MTVAYSIDDIPYELALSAHLGSSFTPEKRAKFERAVYVEHIRGVCEKFEQYRTDVNSEELDAALQRWQVGYLKRLRALLSAKSRHYSGGYRRVVMWRKLLQLFRPKQKAVRLETVDCGEFQRENHVRLVGGKMDGRHFHIEDAIHRFGSRLEIDESKVFQIYEDREDKHEKTKLRLVDA